MIDDLTALTAPIQVLLWAFFLVFLRVGAIVALLPVFGEQSVSARVRLAVAFCFSLIVAPGVIAVLPPQPGSLWQALSQGGAEVAAGLIFGLTLRLFVMALQTAGSIAAQSVSLTQLFGGSAGAEPQPAIGHLLVVAGLALMTLLGLHVQAAAYMIDSYSLLPGGVWPAPASVLAAGLAEVTRSFSLAFGLALPFVAAALIYNLILGAINRAMPQLMVTFVGAPALTLGGLVLLVLAVPGMLQVWASALSGAMAAPFGLP
jgi:flagellar biosynthetic protein FliR